MMNNLTIGKLVTVGGYVASIILAFLWLDERHDHAGEAARAELRANRFALTLSLVDLAGTITRYNTMEEFGELSDSNRIRRAALQRQRNNYEEEVSRITQQLNGN